MCPWISLSFALMREVSLRMVLKNILLPMAATGMRMSSTHSKEGSSTNRNPEAATSCTSVTMKSGTRVQRRSTTTRVSSSSLFTMSPEWKASRPFHSLSSTWPKTLALNIFWVLVTIIPSHHPKATLETTWISMIPTMYPTYRPMGSDETPVAMSTRALHTHTKAIEAAMRTTPMRQLTRTFPRSGRPIAARPFMQVRKSFMAILLQSLPRPRYARYSPRHERRSPRTPRNGLEAGP